MASANLGIAMDFARKIFDIIRNDTHVISGVGINWTPIEIGDSKSLKEIRSLLRDIDATGYWLQADITEEPCGYWHGRIHNYLT